MDFKKLADQAKGLVAKRGGTDSLKEDAAELKGIVGSEGSLSDKAKAAAKAVEDPGAAGRDGTTGVEPRDTGRGAERPGREGRGGRQPHNGHGRERGRQNR